MIPEKHINTVFNSICYRFGDAIIDPGDTWNGFSDINNVLLTHAHFDHIYGLNRIIEENPDAKVYTNEVGEEMLMDARKNMSFYNETPFIFMYPERIILIQDDAEIYFGDGITVKAVFTPGHNPSCITWVVDDMLFTGDSYIPGLKTIINLPGGDKTMTVQSENLIRELSIGKTVYPGHTI